jgi:bacterioferritin
LEFIMQGDPKVIEYLNRGLRHELTAINQYWLHYRLLANWGLSDMAKVWRKESIEEMQHADRITDRIIFLEGFPNMQMLDPLRIGQNVKEIIECDLAAEMSARAVPRGGDVLSFREGVCHPRPFREPDDGRGTPHRLPRYAA